MMTAAIVPFVALAAAVIPIMIVAAIVLRLGYAMIRVPR